MAALSNEQLTAQLAEANAKIIVLMKQYTKLAKAMENTVDRVSVRKALGVTTQRHLDVTKRLDGAEAAITTLNELAGV